MIELPEQAASLHIQHVILWQNGLVMVFDDQATQMASLQGPLEEVRAKIDAVFRGKWEFGHWNTGERFKLGERIIIRDIEMPETTEAKLETGYIIQGRLPDKRKLTVMPLIWDNCARLGISEKPPFENVGVFADVWDFPSLTFALAAFFGWNPDEQLEPSGWHRNLGTRRYRIGGNEQFEYFKIDSSIEQEMTYIINALSNGERQFDSIEEVESGLVALAPKGTKSYMVTSNHIICNGEVCEHHDLALYYLDRCVILDVLEDINLMMSVQEASDIITLRLTGEM